MVENTLKQSLIIFDHDWLRFLERPIVVVFLLLTLVSVSAPLIGRWLAKARGSGEAAAPTGQPFLGPTVSGRRRAGPGP